MKKVRLLSFVLICTLLCSTVLSNVSFAIPLLECEDNVYDKYYDAKDEPIYNQTTKLDNTGFNYKATQTLEKQKETIEVNYNQQIDSNDSYLTYDVTRTIKETLGSVTLRSSEYMYNLDDSADYIYVEFEEGGYAVLLKQTMELLEYSYNGELKYTDNTGKKYYGGPSRYYYRDSDCFIDVNSGASVEISKEYAIAYAQSTRDAFSKIGGSANDNLEIFDYSVNANYSIDQSDNELDATTQNVSDIPTIDDNPYIKDLSISDGTYINNFWYFLLDPMHGTNTTGTCGAVASQLLLSYHNYYSDRRIISNENLNGSDTATERHLHLNYCEDPMSMTPETLGSRGEQEDGSDDPNSYFAMVVDAIPANATVSQVKNGIAALLVNRNNQLASNISYTVSSTHGEYISDAWTPVDASGIIDEIDEGNPVILLMQESLGGSDHYVVAYGYQDYTYPGTSNTYAGFITHFGWGSDYVNVWVNSAWCVSYITLEINHTHSHDQYVGRIGDTGGIEYKCSVCGHRTDEVLNIGDSSRYTERVIDILPSHYKEYQVTFSSAGNRVIQTFGANTLSHDGFLEIFNIDGTRLDYDDDSGYENNALISFYFEANTTYIIRVKFCVTSTYFGNIRLAIIPTNDYSTYEDIYNLTDYSLGLTWNFIQNNVRLLTYQYSTTRDLTMNLSSEIDTYLYIIDPRSTELTHIADGTTTKGLDSLYNDDHDGLRDSEITKTFDAEVPYLVIASAINPSLSTSVGEFYLDFE